MSTNDKAGRQRRAQRRLPLSGDCAKCGNAHRTRYGHQSCVGHKSPGRGGGPCASSPMVGQTICHVHGGRTPRNREAGRRREVQRRAELAMLKFGGPIETDAAQALIDTVKWTAGYVAWLRQIVEGLRGDDLGWGVTQEKTGGQDWGTTESAGQNVYASMLGEWTDRLIKVCAAALRAGVDERRVRLAESQGLLVADVIKRIFVDLELSQEQAARSGEIVVRHLRLLSA